MTRIPRLRPVRSRARTLLGSKGLRIARLWRFAAHHARLTPALFTGLRNRHRALLLFGHSSPPGHELRSQNITQKALCQGDHCVIIPASNAGILIIANIPASNAGILAKDRYKSCIKSPRTFQKRGARETATRSQSSTRERAIEAPPAQAKSPAPGSETDAFRDA